MQLDSACMGKSGPIPLTSNTNWDEFMGTGYRDPKKDRNRLNNESIIIDRFC